MIALSKSDLDLAVIRLKENPNDVLRKGETTFKRNLMTVTELAAFLKFPDSRIISLIALSKALRNEEFPQRRVSTCNGTQRLLAVRNLGKWNDADNVDWVKHYDAHSRKIKFK